MPAFRGMIGHVFRQDPPVLQPRHRRGNVRISATGVARVDGTRDQAVALREPAQLDPGPSAPMPVRDPDKEPRSASLSPAPACPAGEMITRWLMGVLVALFVVTGYAPSLRFGLWFDDHAHFLHLKEAGWSHRRAVEAAYLAVPGEVMDYWGRSEPLIRYYRPVAFTLMKIEYVLAGWRPEIMHGFSMGWHFLCAMLVGSLAMKFLGSRTWATVAACLMAIHPAHVGTVTWIACQTELMTTFFQLIAILAYSRHARWGELFTYSDATMVGQSQGWFAGRLMEATALPSVLTADPDRRVSPAILLSLSCFAMALGCRENAVVLPVVCWLGDRLCGAGRRGWLRWEHVAMAVMVIAYLCIRHWALQGFYSLTWDRMAGISHLEMIRFLFDKPVVYLTGIFCCVPIVPGLTVGQPGGPPLALYAVAVAMFAAFLVIYRLFGRSPAVLWPVAAMLVTMTPTIPIYPSAHHLYLPSVGGVILMTSFMGLVGGIRRAPGQRLSRFRKWVLGAILASHAAGLTIVTVWRGHGLEVGTLPEDLLVEDVISRSPKPIRSGDHLFFINVPRMAALYPSCAVRARNGLSELYAHGLTYSPDALIMQAPGELQVLDRHRLRVRAPRESPYLGGMGGRVLRSMLGLPELKTGDTFRADLDRYEVKRDADDAVSGGDWYTVVIKEADDEGIRELEFVFNRPLDSPDYHFYFGSPQFMAYPVDVSRPTIAVSRPATEPAR